MRTKTITVDEINKQVEANPAEFIEKCESEYKNQIFEVVKKLQSCPGKKFVLIAGPSSSGKTTTSKILKEKLELDGYKAITLSLDDFFVERKDTPLWDDGEYNYETSESIDWKLFGERMGRLLNGEEVVLPTYNFETGMKEFFRKAKIDEKSLVIVEGLHALNPIVDKYIDSTKTLKVYISANTDIHLDGELYIKHKSVRLFRRIIRDLYTRFTGVEGTLKIWQKVSLGETLYIDPFVDSADIAINTFHPYELCVYRKLFDMLKEQSAELNTICLTLEPFETLTTDMVPTDSVLQEFIPHK